MLGEAKSNKNLGGEGVQRQYSDIYGFGNSRIWQDGKGLVSVHVNSVSPSLNYLKPGTDIVLKTAIFLLSMALKLQYVYQV